MGRGFKAMFNYKVRVFPQFVGRTLEVKDNDVESTMRIMNKIMSQEGMIKQYRLTRRFEKPFLTRRRHSYEEAKALYNEDMDRKIQFVLRKNRQDPWIGSS